MPVVGDFAGPEGDSRDWRLSEGARRDGRAFYLSNVEQYLYQDGKWDAFCRNFATLPLDTSSTFIRSSTGAAARFRHRLREQPRVDGGGSEGVPVGVG